MTNLIVTTEHALAAAAAKVVTYAKYINEHVVPILVKAKADEATVEAVTAIVSPQAVGIERVAYAILGLALKALADGTNAASANGLSMQLDTAFLEDLKAIAPAVHAANTSK